MTSLLEPQLFTTPNFPDMYPNNLQCHWIFHAPERGTILINFNFIDIEPCCDIITVIIIFFGFGGHLVIQNSSLGQQTSLRLQLKCYLNFLVKTVTTLDNINV